MKGKTSSYQVISNNLFTCASLRKEENDSGKTLERKEETEKEGDHKP